MYVSTLEKLVNLIHISSAKQKYYIIISQKSFEKIQYSTIIIITIKRERYIFLKRQMDANVRITSSRKLNVIILGLFPFTSATRRMSTPISVINCKS